MVLGLAMVISVTLLIFVWVRRPTGIRSIAVLPLENFSGDVSQDYFADGMTDELITDLAQIRALRVVSRTSRDDVQKETRKPLAGDCQGVER